jgi:hypothetical protein
MACHIWPQNPKPQQINDKSKLPKKIEEEEIKYCLAKLVLDLIVCGLLFKKI